MPEFSSSNYIFLLIIFLIIYLPIWFIVRLFGRKKYKINPMRETAVFLFWAYIFFATYRVASPIFEVDFYDNIRIIPQSENVFIPLEQIFNCIGEMISGGMGMGLADLLLPVVTALPVGFLMALLWDVYYKYKGMAFMAAFLFGMLIQVPQIWTGRGFVTDDALLYGIGVFVGIVILKAVEKFGHNRNKFARKLK